MQLQPVSAPPHGSFSQLSSVHLVSFAGRWQDERKIYYMEGGRGWAWQVSVSLLDSLSCPTQQMDLFSPDDSISGACAHNAVCDRDQAVHGLCFQGKTVTGSAEPVPVEEVKGPLTGAADYFLSSLSKNTRQKREEETNYPAQGPSWF